MELYRCYVDGVEVSGAELQKAGGFTRKEWKELSTSGGVWKRGGHEYRVLVHIGLGMCLCAGRWSDD